MASMISPLVAGSGSLGSQQPRLLHLPKHLAFAGDEALELAEMAGLELDGWQQFVLSTSLSTRPDGVWSALEIGVEVSRQNGKGGILEARELAGLFLLDEGLIIHSAHEFATAEEALERMVSILDDAPLAYRQRIKTVKRSHGQEGIYLRNGQRLRYRTRTKGGGRGFSADLVVLDEAMHIPEAMHGALMPTLSARPNPQIWYTGSAVDQESMDNGLVFARVRDRAVKGEDPRLAYFGWSAPFDHPHEVPEAAAGDPGVWAQANPALGIRITAEYIEAEQRSMDPRTFAVERLGVGDWPAMTADGAVINVKTWLSLVDTGSAAAGEVFGAFDVPTDRSGASIAVASQRDDGLAHCEVIRQDRGTGWVADALEAFARKSRPVKVFYVERSPAAALVTPALAARLKELDVELVALNSGEYGRACGSFFDAVDQRTLRHLGTGEMVTAIKGAAKQPMGEAWAWSRKSSTVDISPLVAATVAHWGLMCALEDAAEQSVWVFS
jgi:hypothetical protein